MPQPRPPRAHPPQRHPAPTAPAEHRAGVGRSLVRTLPGWSPSPCCRCRSAGPTTAPPSWSGCSRSRSACSAPTPTPPTPSWSAVWSRPTQRAAYDEAIAEATQLIAEAAREEPADSAALSALNTELVIYTATVEQARSANRQGFPVGRPVPPQCQRRAARRHVADPGQPGGSQLDAGLQPDGRVGRRRCSPSSGWRALAALVLAQVWLAHRFRRTFNVGLVAASAVGAGHAGRRPDRARLRRR